MPIGNEYWSRTPRQPLPEQGFFRVQRGRLRAVFSRGPARYGFSVVARVKPGREGAVRGYGKTIEEAMEETPCLLEPFRLHYLRWVLFDVGSGLHFMLQGLFDTDTDMRLEDVVSLFIEAGITAVFVNLEGWPDDWRTNLAAVVKFFRDHPCPSFLEYGEYPGVSADEIKVAFSSKAAFPHMPDQMQ